MIMDKGSFLCEDGLHQVTLTDDVNVEYHIEWLQGGAGLRENPVEKVLLLRFILIPTYRVLLGPT